MRYSSLLLLFLAAVIFNSCKKENNSPIVECQDDLSTLSSFLSEKNEQNILITNVEEINGVYHFTFENGETQQFANSCFERIDKNEAEWNYSIRLSNELVALTSRKLIIYQETTMILLKSIIKLIF